MRAAQNKLHDKVTLNTSENLYRATVNCWGYLYKERKQEIKNKQNKHYLKIFEHVTVLNQIICSYNKIHGMNINEQYTHDVNNFSL